MVTKLDWSIWLLIALLGTCTILGLRRNRTVAFASIAVLVLVVPATLTLPPAAVSLWQLLAAALTFASTLALVLASAERWPAVLAALAAVCVWTAFWAWSGLAPLRPSAILLRCSEFGMAALLLRVSLTRSPDQNERT